ncbi:hypothetical protein GCM10009001_04380 [Virgibacillus siamensis]|uniref:HIRAN domain-containing protein n=1 Tax=Virgibacillus siamensis TaxID=480071 RepID=A0ABN1FJ28_9BACI
MDKMNRLKKLLVSWKGTQTGKNYFVGVLEKNFDEYIFKYNKSIVKEAKSEGFTPFVGLNDLSKEYKSNKLFSVFERRLPNKNRNIFKMVVNEHNLNESDDLDWEYLRITKGQLATDSISFLEPVVVDSGNISYKGEIAGWSHTRDYNRGFSINDFLNLKTNLVDNTSEEKAVELIDPQNNDARVGYISKPYNDFFFQLILKGYQINANVVSVDQNSGRPTVEVTSKVNPEDVKECGCDYIITYE